MKSITLHGNHWTSLKYTATHENQSYIVNGNQFNTMYIRYLLNINENRWELLIIKGSQQMQMNSGATQWKSITLNENQRRSMRISGTLWTTVFEQWKLMQANGKWSGVNAQQFWINNNKLMVINKVNWNRENKWTSMNINGNHYDLMDSNANEWAAMNIN